MYSAIPGPVLPITPSIAYLVSASSRQAESDFEGVVDEPLEGSEGTDLSSLANPHFLQNTPSEKTFNSPLES